MTPFKSGEIHPLQNDNSLTVERKWIQEKQEGRRGMQVKTSFKGMGSKMLVNRKI